MKNLKTSVQVEVKLTDLVDSMWAQLMGDEFAGAESVTADGAPVRGQFEK
jgi:hypothetical protein